MNPTKLVTAFVFAVLTATAFVGTSAASAEGSTQLCNAHTSLKCESPTAVVNLENEGVVRFLNSLATVLCLTVRVTGIPLELANPQVIHSLGLEFSGCGTSSTHTNCEVTSDEKPDWNLLKTGLDQGTLEAANGKVHVHCTKVLGFLTIDCTFNFTGLTLTAGSQHLTAEEVVLSESEGAVCPSEAKFDALLKTIKAETEPSLCKVHTTVCKTEDLVKSIDMTTTAAPRLLSEAVNVECESSLTAATVEDPMLPYKPIKLHVTTLSWTGCHPQGSGEACAVSTTGLPTFDLTRTALNLGQAAALEGSSLKIAVTCASLELECTFDGEAAIAFEGASHTAGAGHGMFTAGGTELGKVSGGANCPESMQWDALYELPEDTYLGPYLIGENAYILA